MGTAIQPLAAPEVGSCEPHRPLEVSLPESWGSESAMRHCWADATVTRFDSDAAWPFAQTRVFDRDGTSFPSDHGFLDPEDLGSEVANALKPGPMSTVAPSSPVGKPAITNLRTRKYRLSPSGPIQKALYEWRRAVRTTKNRAIALLNAVTDPKHPFVATEYALYTLLCNNGSEFVRKHPLVQRSGLWLPRRPGPQCRAQHVGQGNPSLALLEALCSRGSAFSAFLSLCSFAGLAGRLLISRRSRPLSQLFAPGLGLLARTSAAFFKHSLHRLVGPSISPRLVSLAPSALSP